MSLQHEPATWHCHLTVAKYWADDPELRGTPYEVFENEGNILVCGGVSNIWQYVIGNGTATTAQTLTYFNSTTAAVGVGDSTTAAADTQTDLQAATNKLRVGMNAGYPDHTPGTTSAAKTIRYRSTFDTTQANWSWQEAGIFNSATAGVGRMLNRKVTDMGTKTSASSFQITFDLTIA